MSFQKRVFRVSFYAYDAAGSNLYALNLSFKDLIIPGR